MEINLKMLASEKLLNAIINGKGIQSIIEIGYELLGNPISFVSPEGIMLAHKEKNETLDAVWDEMIKTGKVPYEVVQSADFASYFAQVDLSGTPVHMKAMGGYDKMTGKVVIDNIVVGYVTVASIKRPFDKNDLEIMTLLCEVVSSEMQKNKARKNARGAVYENFITDLLNGNIGNNHRNVEERLKFLGVKLKENLYVLTINMKDNDVTHVYITHAMHMLERMIPGSKAAYYNENIVLLAGYDAEKTLGGECLGRLLEFLRENKLHGGMSRCFHVLTDMAHYYRQSLKTLELGMWKNKEEVFHTYDDLVLYHFLDIRSDKEDLLEFCHPSLFTLVEYDKDNNTSYVQTLHVYIMNRGNQTDSARALHIHRTTLIYRIDKIEKIMNVRLEDVDTVYYLYISFKIMEFLNKSIA